MIELLNLALGQIPRRADWFQTAESYNGDAWLALGKAAADEPQLWQLRAAWATWKYGLDKVGSPESAWTVFQQIREEADAQQQYLTDSVAGRAVELLVPKLPQERLMDEAVRLIRDTSTFSYLFWRINDRQQFGFRGQPGSVYTGAASTTGGIGSSGNKPQLSVGGFPVAHAVWMLDEQLRRSGEPQPNIIQQRIVPEIVRWHYKDFSELSMRLAAYLGGPVMDKFWSGNHGEPRPICHIRRTSCTWGQASQSTNGFIRWPI